MSKRLPMLAWSMTLALTLGAAPELNAAEGQFEQGVEAFQRGAFEEAATRWTDAARSYAEQRQVASQISALTHLARAQSELGQYHRAAVSLGTALKLAVAAEDRQRTASISAALGNVYIALGPPETAESYLRGALVVARGLDDSGLAAATLNDLGNLLATQKRYAEAVVAYRESLGLATDPKLRLLRARTRINAGPVSRR